MKELEWTLDGKDPYEIMGIDISASASEIAKAYRKKALQLHPDKHANKPTKEKERLQQQFHELQLSKAFLENASAKHKYDQKRASKLVRERAEAERAARQSASQKRFASNLAKAEADAEAQKQGKRKRTSNSDGVVDDLRRQGRDLREKQAQKQAEQVVRTTLEVEERQIRCKWSRKKLSIRKERDLKQLLQQFGKIEKVEFLGNKGNTALVTFVEASSGGRAVEAYADSKEMRASYIIEPTADEDVPLTAANIRNRDNDDDEGWQLRRQIEREKLLRDLEDEEVREQQQSTVSSSSAIARKKPSFSSSCFPIDFDPAFTSSFASPFEKLVAVESEMLPSIVSTPDVWATIQRECSG